MESPPSCFLLLLLRAMGRSHPVSGGLPAPAPTALWGATDVTPRPVPPRITAEQGQRYPLAVDTAARAVTPVLFLCPQPSWVAVSPPPAGPGTHPPSLCTILEGLKGVVLVEVVASTHPHQQVAVEACLYTSTPPPWPCCSSTTSSLTSEVVKVVGVPQAYPPTLMANPLPLLLHTWLLLDISTYQRLWSKIISIENPPSTDSMLLEHPGRMGTIARGPVG